MPPTERRQPVEVRYPNGVRTWVCIRLLEGDVVSNKLTDLCAPLEYGDQIVFTQNRMGCIDSPDSTVFNDHIVNEGDLGLYECPHPVIDGWHICTHKVDENSFVFVPLHRMCFMKREES